MNPQRHFSAAIVILAFVALLPPVLAVAQDDPRTILVKRLDPAPNGSGGTDSAFDTFQINSPVLNHRGQAAFASVLVSSNGRLN